MAGDVDGSDECTINTIVIILKAYCDQRVSQHFGDRGKSTQLFYDKINISRALLGVRSSYSGPESGHGYLSMPVNRL
mgnify:CR=1 FL=1